MYRQTDSDGRADFFGDGAFDSPAMLDNRPLRYGEPESIRQFRFIIGMGDADPKFAIVLFRLHRDGASRRR